MSSDPMIPKGAVPLMGALVVLSLVFVSGAVLLGYGPKAKAIPTAAASTAHVELSFHDMGDGGIRVVSPNGEMVLAPGTSSFIRHVMRAFARGRRGQDEVAAAPFVLALLPDHRLIFADPTTGTQVDLRAYGKDNKEAFATLLPLANPRPSAAVMRDGKSASLAEDAINAPKSADTVLVESEHVRPL